MSTDRDDVIRRLQRLNPRDPVQRAELEAALLKLRVRGGKDTEFAHTVSGLLRDFDERVRGLRRRFDTDLARATVEYLVAVAPPGSDPCKVLRGLRDARRREDLRMTAEYKGCQIEIRTNKAPDADGWRVYADITRHSGGETQTTPVYFRDGRTFPTEAAAEAAGLHTAKAWIDERG